jgi:hypothetical protein
MKSYAGIGSRDITSKEYDIIIKIAKIMAKSDWILYSGNADGSDIAFQEGSNGKCVIMLPWNDFNIDNYDYTFSRDYFILGKNKDALNSIDKYHPNPKALKSGGKALMARNYYQINGYKQYPKVSLVICCADERNGQIKGGTGQATRIAQKQRIPVINIRISGWKDKLFNFIMKK